MGYELLVIGVFLSIFATNLRRHQLLYKYGVFLKI